MKRRVCACASSMLRMSSSRQLRTKSSMVTLQPPSTVSINAPRPVPHPKSMTDAPGRGRAIRRNSGANVSPGACLRYSACFHISPYFTASGLPRPMVMSGLKPSMPAKPARSSLIRLPEGPPRRDGAGQKADEPQQDDHQKDDLDNPHVERQPGHAED